MQGKGFRRLLLKSVFRSSRLMDAQIKTILIMTWLLRQPIDVFNRDLAACLNMIIILKSVRNGTGIPAKYQRAQRQQSVPALQQH
ncbi:hypothetical protein [Parasitella parasitica]|uniref:Uncharacterized protein n=1 Tax=Parasitella parasitica TaxID=35722 RepID=A0A0B7N0F0_9FUNG|nr:hypothetical protein [Parasitella parasitica]